MRQRSGEHSVEKMCRILKVSKSGYYRRLAWSESTTRQENRKIYDVLKASYERNKGRTGLNKLLGDVRLKFSHCGRNRLYHIQKEHQLYSIRKRKFKATTNSRHNYPVTPNLLRQHFHVDAPNKVWVTDITYVRTDKGWLYLAIVKNLFDHQIVGCATGNRIDTDLCKRALSAAIRRYKPGTGLIHHSDQGVQYASRNYQALVLQNRIIPSMSRKGTPYDNACAESFFSTIKLKMVYHKHYATRVQAQTAIFEYIEIYYNRRRRNAAIGNIAPAEFWRRFYQQRAA
ncbi:IS3 family transposase [Ethanoligenens sp.]|uniref:IS3 family transposase n=1 Tax=Ethanoligenens sp. TaxID=2099655 RepID=UPI0039E75441